MNEYTKPAENYAILQIERSELEEMKEVLKQADQAIALSEYFIKVIHAIHTAIQNGHLLTVDADNMLCINGTPIATLIKETA